MRHYKVTFTGWGGSRDKVVNVCAPDAETAKFNAMKANPGWYAVQSVEAVYARLTA